MPSNEISKTNTWWVYSNDVVLFQSKAKQTLITRLHEKEEDDGNDSPYSCSHQDVAETDGTQTSVSSSVHWGCSWSEQIINGTYLNAVFFMILRIDEGFLKRWRIKLVEGMQFLRNTFYLAFFLIYSIPCVYAKLV